MLKLLFAGDVSFRNIEPLSACRADSILEEVRSYLEDADYRIINLETPLADKSRHSPIRKSGPNLICMPENISFLKSFGADAVTLANNHIGDYGEKAVCETTALLDGAGIMHAGAGEDIGAAYAPFYIKKGCVSAAVISVCENEFGTASDDSWGSAGYDPRRMLKAIREEKDKADFVIVVFHGGNEFDPFPSPGTYERYHLICDMGADAVIACHTHCPQGYEYYCGKPIVYSMGNFLFSSSFPRKENDPWHYGYLVMMTVCDMITVEPIPYRFDPGASHIKVFSGMEREKMLDYISEISSVISDRDKLGKLFEGWSWMHQWCPSLPGGAKEYNAAGNYNLVSCESHLDQLKCILGIYHRNILEEASEWAERIKKYQIMPV